MLREISLGSLTKLKYKDSGWTVCSDLKVICMLLGQHAGYTKYPCFLCEWDNLDKKYHWIKKKWLHRKTLKPGNKNVVVEESLVDPSKVLLPPLHIKLGLMKQFVNYQMKESASNTLVTNFRTVGRKNKGMRFRRSR
ncbi:hypothetical protein AVEN_252094-1 [Araneus ventricosus]|uniref:Uncharacterized protein n=1 Tax=Araneus ventricosus TaxID=182803 RepID=A0A4Y2TBD3_ARAVE|nr:hypothetical protein AVEN_252094-1 [Araneus ventricosus]